MVKRALCLLIILSLSACGTAVSTTSPQHSLNNISALELTISRASLYSTDFEHYKLQDGNLFYECGELQRNRYIPRAQEFQKVDDKLVSSIQVAANTLLSTKDTKAITLPPPGKNAHFADPGILTLVLATDNKKEEFKTSLDDTLSASSELSEDLLEVSRRIRGLTSSPPCNIKIFYGLKPLQ